jgi:hypothetical protein
MVAGVALCASLLVCQPAYAATILGRQLNVPQGSASLNWAGYVAKEQGTYTSVTGTWTVPTVPAATPGAADATWVGIGGVQTHDLIQAGTQALVNGNGTVTYTAWVETLPGYSQTVSLPVTSGDSITATLSQVSQGIWSVVIQDNTSGQSYSAQLDYSSSLSSAEWVEEMVSNQNGAFIPLDSFGSVGFTGASATVNGMSQNLAELGAQPLPMVNSAGSVLASVSVLGGDGASFNVTRTNSSPSAAMPRGTMGRWHVIQTATSTPGSDPGFTFVRRGRHFGFSFVLMRF